MRHGLATPCFGSDPTELADLGVRAEAAGFDGFFIWDHMLFADGTDVLDPWVVLSLVAARTNSIRIGTVVTPLSRRRPWVLARQIATLDIVTGGRTVLGVGLGSPAEGDFERFGERSDSRTRADMLDEGLDVFAGLTSGSLFAYQGEHYHVRPVRFTPTPVQQPRIPVWVGGVLPALRPMSRAARWDGAVPIRFGTDGQVVRPSAADIGAVRNHISTRRTTMTYFDLVVWSEVAASAKERAIQAAILPSYQAAGATWWIETGRPVGFWWEELCERVDAGA